MNGAIICLDSWFGSLCVHRAVGQRHAVGSPVGLTLVTVLIVDHVVFGLAALDLIRGNKIIDSQSTHLGREEKVQFKPLLTWGMLIPFRICSCSQRLTSSSWPVSSASSSLPSIPAQGTAACCRTREFWLLIHRAHFTMIPISSAIFCLWVLFLTPLKRILFSSSSSLASWSSSTRCLSGASVSTRGASPPSSLASWRRFLAAWIKAASGISPEGEEENIVQGRKTLFVVIQVVSVLSKVNVW